jgi:hypothetical protein
MVMVASDNFAEFLREQLAPAQPHRYAAYVRSILVAVLFAGIAWLCKGGLTQPADWSSAERYWGRVAALAWAVADVALGLLRSTWPHGGRVEDGKRSAGHRPQATAPILDSTYARPLT